MFAKIEKALLDRGHVLSAGCVWFFAEEFEVLYRPRKKQEDWMIDLMDHVYRGMSLKQSEIQHKQTLQSLEKLEKVNGGLTKEERGLLELCRRRIPMFERMWWSQNRDYYGHLYNRPKGAWGRLFEILSHEAIRAHKQFPEAVQWSHRDSRSACKAVGGCCTYDCGCCSKERVPGVKMHCTTGCGCCLARRGFALKDLKHDELPPDETARLDIALAYCIDVGLEEASGKC